jgi:hypothetical protein
MPDPYTWTDEKAAAAERATRTPPTIEGVAISLAADVPHDHEWWSGDDCQWHDEPALRVFDAWWPIIHRPKVEAAAPATDLADAFHEWIEENDLNPDDWTVADYHAAMADRVDWASR